MSFLKYLDTLRVSESFRSVWIFAESSYKIFDYAKKRVYRLMRSDSVKLEGQSTSMTRKKRKLKGAENNENEGELLHCCFLYSFLYLKFFLWHEYDRDSKFLRVIKRKVHWQALR